MWFSWLSIENNVFSVILEVCEIFRRFSKHIYPKDVCTKVSFVVVPVHGFTSDCASSPKCESLGDGAHEAGHHAASLLRRRGTWASSRWWCAAHWSLRRLLWWWWATWRRRAASSSLASTDSLKKSQRRTGEGKKIEAPNIYSELCRDGE